MFNLIPGGFGGRVTRSYVGGNGIGSGSTSMSITANVDLGAESGERRVVIVCAGQSVSTPSNALNFTGFSITGSPTIDTVYSTSVLDGFVGRCAAIGIVHYPEGTSGISVTANYSQSGTISYLYKGILVYSVYGLSDNTPFNQGTYGSYDMPLGSIAIAFSQHPSAPTWTGVTQDAFQSVVSGASFESEIGETGRTISADISSLRRVVIWAPN